MSPSVSPKTSIKLMLVPPTIELSRPTLQPKQNDYTSDTIPSKNSSLSQLHSKQWGSHPIKRFYSSSVVQTRGTRKHLVYPLRRPQSESQLFSQLCKSGADDRLRIFTRAQALDWIGARVSPGQMREDVTSAHKPSPAEIASQALAAMVISHVKVRNMNFRPKGIYLATMARRVLMAMIDESMVDDRDYVGNKRLEL